MHERMNNDYVIIRHLYYHR